MKNKLQILLLLTTTIVLGQNGRFLPSKNEQKVFDTIPLTFHQKLNKYTKFNPKCISFKYSNLDTVNCRLSFDLEFFFSEKPLKILLTDLLGDTIAKEISVNKRLNIKSNDISLRNVSGMNFLKTESIISIKTINDKTINKKLPILVFFKSEYGSPRIDIYIELSNNVWYYLYYYKSVMSAVSSNQQFNSSLINSKTSNKECLYSICSPAKKDMFLRKLKFIEETTGR
jgi:hypothetical protein